MSTGKRTVFYHTTDSEPFGRFNTPEAWLDTAPRDYGDNVAVVEYNWKKAFVTSPQEAEEHPELGVSEEQAAKNREKYIALGGEISPASFDWMREQGYDLLIDNEGYAALYPDRTEILEWMLGNEARTDTSKKPKTRYMITKDKHRVKIIDYGVLHATRPW